MESIVINNKTYEVINNYKDAINIQELETKITDYFDYFDYIVGDISYGKLRLKGFNKKDNKNYKSFNDIERVDDYIKNNCAYGCRWFMIREIKEKERMEEGYDENKD